MPADNQKFQDFQERARSSNISEYTLLSTDYLNHLNGPIMLLDMVGDMPQMLQELNAWQPKSYVEHFRESSLPDNELAIEAYALSPKRFREPLEEIIERVNACIIDTVDALQIYASQQDIEGLRTVAQEAASRLKDMVRNANAIMHGFKGQLSQDQIDEIMAVGLHSTLPVEPNTDD